MSVPARRSSGAAGTAGQCEKENTPPPECHLDIGQSGPGDDDEDNEEALCRICYDGGKSAELLLLCRCKGSMGYTHLHCLEHWLDTSQRTHCEVCGYAYLVQLTRRYALLPSICVWLRRVADRRSLVIDLITAVVTTPLMGAFMYISIRGVTALWEGSEELNPGGTAEPLTAAGVVVLFVATAVAYIIWMVFTFSTHVRDWYIWWSSAYRIRVLRTSVDERQRSLVDNEGATSQTETHRIYRIFSRGSILNPLAHI